MAFSSVSPLFLTRTLLIELGLTWVMGFPGGTVVKNPPANAGDKSSIPGLGGSPGGGTYY